MADYTYYNYVMTRIGATSGYYKSLDDWGDAVIQQAPEASINYYYRDSIALVQCPDEIAVLFKFCLTPELKDYAIYICVIA